MSKYDVGYKKPPKHTRFKKGVCPNPKGRPRKPRPEEWRIIQDVLARQVSYREGEKVKSASLKELAIRGVLERLGTEEDIGAIKRVFAILRQLHSNDDAGPLVITVVNPPRRSSNPDFETLAHVDPEPAKA